MTGTVGGRKKKMFWEDKKKVCIQIETLLRMFGGRILLDISETI